MVTSSLGITALRSSVGRLSLNQSSKMSDKDILAIIKSLGINMEDFKLILGIFEKINSMGSLQKIIQQMSKIMQLLASLN